MGTKWRTVFDIPIFFLISYHLITNKNHLPTVRKIQNPIQYIFTLIINCPITILRPFLRKHFTHPILITAFLSTLDLKVTA